MVWMSIAAKDCMEAPKLWDTIKISAAGYLVISFFMFVRDWV